MFRNLWLLLIAMALVPGEALASGGLQHAEEWVLRRDGAWIFNFLILFAGLYWLFIRYIIPALKQRSLDIGNAITVAEKLKENTVAALKKMEDKSAQFDSEAIRMKNDAIAEGEKVRDKIVADAKEQSKRILQKAKAEIQAEIMLAKRRLRQDTVEVAVGLATKTLSKDVGKKDHQEIVKTYLDSVKEG